MSSQITNNSNNNSNLQQPPDKRMRLANGQAANGGGQNIKYEPSINNGMIIGASQNENQNFQVTK